MSEETYGADDYIQCACVHCGWVDGFLAEVAESGGGIIGFCDACGQEYEFVPVVNLIHRLSATQAELDGADKVISNLKAQRDELHGVMWEMLHHFGNPKRDEWLNDEGFEAAKLAVEAARKLLKGQ